MSNICHIGQPIIFACKPCPTDLERNIHTCCVVFTPILWHVHTRGYYVQSRSWTFWYSLPTVSYMPPTSFLFKTSPLYNFICLTIMRHLQIRTLGGAGGSHLMHQRMMSCPWRPQSSLLANTHWTVVYTVKTFDFLIGGAKLWLLTQLFINTLAHESYFSSTVTVKHIQLASLQGEAGLKIVQESCLLLPRPC